MKQKFLLFFLVASIATSCTTQKSTTAKKMDIYGSGVIQHPIIAEMEVSSTKVTGTATGPSGTTIETVKSSAVVDALKKSNADVLVEPSFETVTSGSTVSATVTGFPATYKNFRPVTIDDVPLLELGIIQKASTFEPKTTEKKANVSSAAALGIIGSIGAIILLLLLI